MKKIALLTVFLIMAFMVNAQKGQKQFNAGLGFAHNVIPVYIGFDYWVHEDISIGGEIGWRRESYNETNNTPAYYETTWNFLFNSNYHFSRILEIPKKFDPYAGLNIGLYYYDYDGYTSNTSGLGMGVQIGFRYYFTDKFAAGIEFSGGNRVSDGKIGISLKF
ncbi:MAG: hypothetical protein DRJ10_11035 [Bacteroidetes bacterium]|nr:MAG: hypothetical protein DRJ10_11035 [Bacteroidota bacterium]